MPIDQSNVSKATPNIKKVQLKQPIEEDKDDEDDEEDEGESEGECDEDGIKKPSSQTRKRGRYVSCSRFVSKQIF